MSENTKIEWADHTFNPWIGCTKVGPGCDNCYAKADFEDRKHRVTWGAGQPRSLTKTWSDPVRWDKQHAAFFAEHGRRQRVFCASLGDVFDNEVPDIWRSHLFELIDATPNLDWLLLTKRIGNANAMLDQVTTELYDGLLTDQHPWNKKPWPNVWIGATIVNQEEADRDIPKLLAVPAAKRLLSMEPLLGPVDLGLCNCDKGSRTGPGGVGGVTCTRCNGSGGRMLDWVIVGGESGPNARPMHPDWARSLRDQCEVIGVPFMFKQWGQYSPHEIDAAGYVVPGMPMRIKAMVEWSGDLDRFALPPADAMANEVFKPGAVLALPVGKKAAGRLLDGREWNGVPS